MPRPCGSSFINCGSGCPPCVSPCSPSPCPGCCPGGGAGSCSITGALFANATAGVSIVGGSPPAILVVTAPFVSTVAEQLAIDASAFVAFSGSLPPFDVEFEVLVDGVAVPSSKFGTLAGLEEAESGSFSSSTTLLVTVPGGQAHVVALQWSSPGGAVGTTDTIIAANLRVLRLACV